MSRSKAVQDHMNAVQALGCIVTEPGDSCPCGAPAHLHHILEGRHSQRKSDDMRVLPLCPMHHQQGGYGVAIHAGPAAWRAKYGSEIALLELVNDLMRMP